MAEPLDFDEILSDTNQVISDPFKFKRKLEIGDEAFEYLRNSENTLDFIESVAAGLGAGTLAYLGWVSSLGLIGQLGVLVGITATPVGWIIGAGAVGGAAFLGLKKFKRVVRKKIEGKTTEKIPKYLNTPLDIIGMNIALILSSPALKIACSDGNYCEREKDFIIDHFVNVWGYERNYIEPFLEKQFQEIHLFDLEKYSIDLKEITKSTKEIKWNKLSSYIIVFIEELMMADGKVHDLERQELINFKNLLK